MEDYGYDRMDELSDKRPPVPPFNGHHPPPHWHHHCKYDDPHEPQYFAQDGRYPGHPVRHGPPDAPPPKPEKLPPPCVVPPPIPPVRYVPGLDVSEQLTNMANHVNECINRWNHIQHDCFAALDNMVGAAVSNDVYYDPEEVRFSRGYSSADGCPYEIIESRPVDKAGRPIIVKLQTAYNSGQSSVRESILEKSFVASANAIITASMNGWSGLCMVGGNPQPTNTPESGAWLCGFTINGILRLLPADATSIKTARQNQIVDCIGPVIPILQNGKITEQAKNAETTPGAIQAIGWKACNGNKVMFSCGAQDSAGCKIINVASILQSMGVTTAAVTCFMTSYGTEIVTQEEPETTVNALLPDGNVNNVEAGAESIEPVGIVPEPWTLQADQFSGNETLGLTGGMAYIGQLSDRPFNYQIPQNSAFWVISKRPGPQWPNRWTGEIADICQKLGANATELDSVQGKLDLEQKQIIDLQNRVGDLEANDKKQDQLLQNHETRITNLEQRMTTAETNIVNLRNDLTQETQDRIAGDQNLQNQINQEIQDRIAGDTNLQNQINQEINDRKAADTQLQNNINQVNADLQQEIIQRNQGDINLSNAIQNEANARQTYDIYLETLINQNKAQLTQDLQKEIQDRIAGDNNLQQQITQEITDRKAEDQKLQAQIDALDQKATQCCTDVNARIDQEIKDRTDSDKDLQDQIDALKNNIPSQLTLLKGSGIEFTAGPNGETVINAKTAEGLTIDDNNAIIVKIDHETIKINENGELYADIPETSNGGYCDCDCDGDVSPGFTAGENLSFTADPITGEITLNAAGGGSSDPNSIIAITFEQYMALSTEQRETKNYFVY